MPTQVPTSDLCGVILAGGKSRRMGRDKALLEINGQPMITRLAELLASVTDEILISANNSAALEPFGYPVIPDQFPGQGPLAGLHAAMLHSHRPIMILLACDLPRLHTAILQSLIDNTEGFDAVVPRTSDGRGHPLCALYRRSCLLPAAGRLARGENRMSSFLGDPALMVRWLSPEEGSFSDQDLVNLNSHNDLEMYLR